MKKALEEDNKKLRIMNYTYAILIFVVLYFLFFNQIMSLAYSKTQPKISFNDLNTSEIKQAKEYLSLLEPEYYSTLRNVEFTKNLSYIGQPDKNMMRVGINTPIKNKIVIYYYGIRTEDLDTLCHEIAHTIIDYPNEEYFADSLAKHFVCYNNKKLTEYILKNALQGNSLT